MPRLVLATTVGILLIWVEYSTCTERFSLKDVGNTLRNRLQEQQRVRRDAPTEDPFSGEGEEQPAGRGRRLPPPMDPFPVAHAAPARRMLRGSFNTCSRRNVRIQNYMSGEISLPTSLTFFTASVYCRWLIVAPRRRTIEARIPMLNIGYQTQCSSHRLELFDGRYSSSPRLGAFCGYRAPMNAFRSTGHFMLVTFRSESISFLLNRRFRLTFTINNNVGAGHVRRTRACPTHPRLLTTDQGYIESPGYPRSSYPKGVNCSWHISMPSNYVVELTVEDFSLEASLGCTEDRLRLYDGTEEKHSRLADYCGQERIDPITSVSNNVVLRFTSNQDTTAAERGFRIKYRKKDPKIPPSIVDPRRPFVPVCGSPEIMEQQPRGRVVGGQQVYPPHSYPWVVQMKVFFEGFDYVHFCGAVLVDPEWVLTTTHCTLYQDTRGHWQTLLENLTRIQLVTGEYDTMADEGTERSHSVSKAIPFYPYYNSSHQNDILLFKIYPPAQIGKAVMPICLPRAPYAAGTYARVVGWGRTNSLNEPFPQYDSVMRKIVVPIIDKVTCNQANYYDGRLTTGMFCAGFEEGGRDACKGDSGGPLFSYSNEDNRWYLYGLVSWGFDCALAEKPGVYTDVFYYSLWIRQEIINNS